MQNELQWKYRELPPFALFEALKLNLLYADECEVERASWFWLRRPKPLFIKSLLRFTDLRFRCAIPALRTEGGAPALSCLEPRDTYRCHRKRSAAHPVAM
jgi:hypothetical protein